MKKMKGMKKRRQEKEEKESSARATVYPAETELFRRRQRNA